MLGHLQSPAGEDEKFKSHLEAAVELFMELGDVQSEGRVRKHTFRHERVDNAVQQGKMQYLLSNSEMSCLEYKYLCE